MADTDDVTPYKIGSVEVVISAQIHVVTTTGQKNFRFLENLHHALVDGAQHLGASKVAV